MYAARQRFQRRPMRERQDASDDQAREQDFFHFRHLDSAIPTVNVGAHRGLPAS
jgi:hypothetical protein